MPDRRPSARWRRSRLRAGSVLVCACLVWGPAPAVGAVGGGSVGATARASAGEHEGTSLESAAAKAGATGRTVAMSLIGLALAVAAVVLAFRRDFKEAAAVFAVGFVAVLLATPIGVSLLRDTVSSLFGGP